jgi:hypothetical protein
MPQPVPCSPPRSPVDAVGGARRSGGAQPRGKGLRSTSRMRDQCAGLGAGSLGYRAPCRLLDEWVTVLVLNSQDGDTPRQLQRSKRVAANARSGRRQPSSGSSVFERGPVTTVRPSYRGYRAWRCCLRLRVPASRTRSEWGRYRLGAVGISSGREAGDGVVMRGDMARLRPRRVFDCALPGMSCSSRCERLAGFAGSVPTFLAAVIERLGDPAHCRCAMAAWSRAAGGLSGFRRRELIAVAPRRRGRCGCAALARVGLPPPPQLAGRLA